MSLFESPHIPQAGHPAAEPAVYLFCFATADLLSAVAGISRLGDVVLHRSGDLVAVCGWTAIEQWSGPQGERNLQDLQWLGPRVLRHQAVIEAAMQTSAVLPARLGTLFSSVDALDRFLTMHAEAIVQFLTQTAGQNEWAVKGLLDRGKAGDWMLSKLLAAQSQPAVASGARYLQQRRMHVAATQELNQWVVRTLESLTDELRRHAVGFRQRGVVPSAEPGKLQTVVNFAFLVAFERVQEFRGCVEQANREHREHGLELALSGPWPPYSFCPTLEMPP